MGSLGRLKAGHRHCSGCFMSKVKKTVAIMAVMKFPDQLNCLVNIVSRHLTKLCDPSGYTHMHITVTDYVVA